MLIGAMHMREHPSKVARVYSFAAAAKMEGVKFFYFSPSKINFVEKTIRGYYYKNGEWLKKTYPFPKVVINMFRANTDKQQRIYERLREEVNYTESSVGNKETVYNIVSRNIYLNRFLPDTEIASNISNIERFVDKYKKIVLKPMLGCQGIGVVFIEKINDGYKIYSEGNERFVSTLEGLFDDIDLELQIIQQFVVSETSTGLPIDYRIHTQKNEDGKYELTTIYPRIANVKNKVTNYSQGGYTTEVKSFLEHEFKDDWINVYNLMRIFGVQLSEYINDYYDDALNELGIDVGLDKNKDIYLYEINWRPGVPIPFNGELKHARNIIRYCKYKSKNS